MGETDAVILEKTRHALAQGLIPILCIGEHERDEDANYLRFIRAQIASIFSELEIPERKIMILAYEPLWAIGKTAAEAIQKDDLWEMVVYIRKVLGEYLPGAATEQVKILYGGSTEASNAPMLADSGIDGFLVGHASADVAQYTKLVKALF